MDSLEPVPPDGRRLRILVLNQYYRPGVEATANLLADLCEALARDYEVAVVTGRVQGHEDLPADEVVNGVRVLRARSAAFDRTKLHRRAVNYVTYIAGSLVRALSLPKPDLVLCMTDPPIVGDLGLLVARAKRAPLLVISEDVFPEIATELGRLTNPILVGVLGRLVSFYLRRADTVVAIGDRMRERLLAKGVPPERVLVISNWVDTSEITPQPRDNEWSRGKRLDDRFVVMHSGNVGHAQNLDALVVAATHLRHLEQLSVLVIGSGARHAEIRGLAKGLSGYVVPSRLYGILSAGRPAIVAADADSETARLVAAVGCGVVVPPDRPDLVAKAIQDAHDGVLDLEEMGRRGREYVVA